MNSRHDAVYAHLALRDPKSIRVFDLQPYHQEFPDAIISGTLRVVDLATSPHYVALSYVWGTSSSPARRIACGAHSVAVTDNLWDALDSLRRDPQREDRGRNSDGSITLWIDALCIHQSNQQEVASQIHLMGDIYASSSSLCIWLGKDTPLSDKAVDFMQRVGWQDLFEKEGEYFYRMPTSKTRWTLALLEFTKILAMALRLGRAPKRSWNASLDETDEILRNVWTRRMWTLQEASMSPHPWICYGRRRLSWRNVLYATQYLNWAPGNLEDFNTGFRKTDYEAWFRIASMWVSITQPPRDGYWDRPSGLRGPEVVLRDYVNFLHGIHTRTQFLLRLGTYVFTASVWITAMCCVSLIPGIPSHRVYIAQIVLGVWFGLYSLAWAMFFFAVFSVPYPGDRQSGLDAAVQETWLRDCSQPQDKVYGVYGVMTRLGVELLRVDMSVTLGNLYHDFFLDLLQATRNLNLLLAAGSALPDQPSWVPDWRLKLADHWIDPSVYLGKRMSSVVRVTPMKRTKWGRGMEGYLGIYGFGPGDGLIVKGWKIGSVAWMGAAFTPVSTNVPTQEAEKTPHIQNLEILQVAMKRSRCSRNNPGYYVFSAPLTRTAKEPDSKFKRHHPIDWPVDWRRPCTDILEKLERKPPVWSVFVNDMCNPLAAKRRTLFWSDGPAVEGLGNLPASARVGDEVLLVYGVALPVVLRRHDDGDGFQLIGYAVFESLDVMEGKIWAEMMAKDEGDGLQAYTIN